MTSENAPLERVRKLLAAGGLSWLRRRCRPARNPAAVTRLDAGLTSCRARVSAMPGRREPQAGAASAHALAVPVQSQAAASVRRISVSTANSGWSLHPGDAR